MRRGCCPKEGLKRGAWTSQEDKILSDYVKTHGLGRWRSLPANAGLNRCGKSCRLRWLNYLRPDIKRGNITDEEEELIIRLHKLLGNRWSLIAGRLPGRTDNEIKNYWNTYLRKKLSGDSPDPQQQSSPGGAKRSEKPSRKDKDREKEKSEVSVIRTKATRCTRPLFADQASDPQFLSNASANSNTDEVWISDVMQNSLFSRDGSYNNTSTTDGFSEEQYMRELFSGCSREGEGTFCSFMEPDSWECFVTPQKSFGFLDLDVLR